MIVFEVIDVFQRTFVVRHDNATLPYRQQKRGTCPTPKIFRPSGGVPLKLQEKKENLKRKKRKEYRKVAKFPIGSKQMGQNQEFSRG